MLYHNVNRDRTDLHPGQILLGMSEREQQDLGDMSKARGLAQIFPVRKPDDGAFDSSRPEYLVEAIFTEDMDISGFSGPAVISDFGDAFLMTDIPKPISDRGPYITPEFCLLSRISSAADVWAFGCIVFQLLSGRDLFGAPDDCPEKVVTSMMNALGKPPEMILEAWHLRLGRTLSVIDTPHRPLAIQIQEIREGNLSLGIRPRRQDLSGSQIAAFTSMLGAILVYDPSKRPTIAEVLRNPHCSHIKHSPIV